MLVGRDAQVPERALVAMLDPGAADHLRAHETGAEAASLAPKGLHADARHRREDEPRRDLHRPDRPWFAKVDHGRNGSRGPSGALRGCCGSVAARLPCASAWRGGRRVLVSGDDAGGLSLKDVILTPEGYETLKQELDTLRTDRRREIAERIRTAREFGDIAENAEYDDAKNEQAMLEHKIAQLEERLAHARVIDTARGRHERRLGRLRRPPARRRRQGDARVLHRRLRGGEPGRAEASNESPVGKAILGHKKGETVEVITPRGSKVKFKIMEIKAA